MNGTADYSNVAGGNSASFFVNFELPIFNRNQGEIVRTRYALTQAQELQASGSTLFRPVLAMPTKRSAVRRSGTTLCFGIFEAGPGLA